MRIRIEGEVTLEKLAKALELARAQLGDDAYFLEGNLYFKPQSQDGSSLDVPSAKVAPAFVIPANARDRKSATAKPIAEVKQTNKFVRLSEHELLITMAIYFDKFGTDAINRVIESAWNECPPLYRAGPKIGQAWPAPTIFFEDKDIGLRVGSLRVRAVSLISDKRWPDIFKGPHWAAACARVAEQLAPFMTAEQRAAYATAIEFLCNKNGVPSPQLTA